jgi:hypothetical protein
VIDNLVMLQDYTVGEGERYLNNNGNISTLLIDINSTFLISAIPKARKISLFSPPYV